MVMVKKGKDSKNESNSRKDIRLDLLREVASSVAGKNTVPIIDLLFEKKNVNEFLIAKKLDLSINQVRNVLYKLSDDGLVSFIRKKDKKEGWYTYFWTFNEERGLALLKKIVENHIEQQEHQLKSRSVKQFYGCAICNSEISDENALLHDFVCPECGEIYELKDNSKAIKEISSIIDRFKERLEIIDTELATFEEKRAKSLIRTRKKVEKEKLKKRKEAARKRAETKKKNAKAKKAVAKKPKKKVVKKTKKVAKKSSSKKKK